MVSGLTFNSVKTTGPAKLVVKNGREYLVAPATSIVEGILPGSKGDLLYTRKDINNNVQRWDNVPLVLWHPTDATGQHVSATEHPQVADYWSLGKIRNSRPLDEEGTKLGHEFWFDVEKVRNHDLRLDQAHKVLPRLKEGKPIEISTGLYTQNKPVPPGTTWKGRQFSAIATNYRPDHIAVLPDQVGACSINNGCGVNVANAYQLTVNAINAQLLGNALPELDLAEDEVLTEVVNHEEFGVGITRKAQGVPSLTPSGSKAITEEDDEDHDEDDGTDIGGHGDELLDPAPSQGKAGKSPTGKPGLKNPAIISPSMGKKGGMGQIDTPRKGHKAGGNRLVSSGGVVGNGLPTTNVWTPQARLAAAATHHAMAAAHHDGGGGGDSSGAGGISADQHMSDAHTASKWATQLGQHAYDSAAALGDPTRATGSAISTAAAYQQAALAHRLASTAHDKAGNKKAHKKHKEAEDHHHKMADILMEHGGSKEKMKKKKGDKIVKNTLTNNSVSHDEIRTRLHHQLGKHFTQDQERPWIKEVHNDHVLYEHGGKTYRQKYRLNKKDEPELHKSGPKCVVRKTSYEDTDDILGPGGSNTNPAMGPVFAGNAIGDDMTREEVINALVTNCSCWKGKEQLLANQQMFTDEQLSELLTNASVAAVMRTSGIAVGDNKIVYNAQTNKFVLNKKAPGSNADENDNAPEVEAGASGDMSGEDDYEDQPYGAKQEVRAGLGIRKGPHKMAKKKKGTEGEEEVTGNAAKWFEQAPPEVQEAVRNSMAIVHNEKVQVVGHLTSYIADPQQKQQITANLMKMALPDLKQMAAMVPQRPQSPWGQIHQVPIQNQNPFMPGYQSQIPVGQPQGIQQQIASIPQFAGQGLVGIPQITQNQQFSDEDPLELPTMNFEAEKKEMDALAIKSLSGARAAS